MKSCLNPPGPSGKANVITSYSIHYTKLYETIPPSIIGIVFTGLRVPVGWMLSLPKILGMVGVWWAISLSSVVKGLVSMTWFIMVVNQLNDKSSIDL